MYLPKQGAVSSGCPSFTQAGPHKLLSHLQTWKDTSSRPWHCYKKTAGVTKNPPKTLQNQRFFLHFSPCWSAQIPLARLPMAGMAAPQPVAYKPPFSNVTLPSAPARCRDPGTRQGKIQIQIHTQLNWNTNTKYKLTKKNNWNSKINLHATKLKYEYKFTHD